VAGVVRRRGRGGGGAGVVGVLGSLILSLPGCASPNWYILNLNRELHTTWKALDDHLPIDQVSVCLLVQMFSVVAQPESIAQVPFGQC
jgi:hypothetical protein